jgi:predicted short-subunit dehydrogenase-like oxidoreductase (DUF2520 family)
MQRIRIIGQGRAGGSIGAALAAVGYRIGYFGRSDDISNATDEADVVIIATPDGVIASIAGRITPDPNVAVLHLSGALGLDVLAGHVRRGSLHPLVSLPDATVGASRLHGAWMAVAGDDAAEQLARQLAGRTFHVNEAMRTTYHATATIAANHLTAVLGQVERLAAQAGVPFEAFVDLARGALEGAAALGPAAALTGAVSRGDWTTVANHLAALPPDERAFYRACAQQAARLAQRPWPNALDEPR